MKTIFKGGPTSDGGLYISPRWICAAIALAGLATVFMSDLALGPLTRVQVLAFALLFYTIAGLAWLLEHRQLWYGRWFLSLALAGIVLLGWRWLAEPSFLALLPLPVIVAMALAGAPAANTTAIVESSLWLLLVGFTTPSIPLSTTLITLLAIWATTGLLLTMAHPLQQVMQWSWQQYQRVQQMLEEARDRKAELEQVLSELLHANRQLDLLNERLAATRLLAEEAHQAKASFVAKVSHEFRTPLNMIIGLTDLLVETPDVYGTTLPAALLEDLKIVHRNCAHLASLINDVLDLSQTEAGRLVLHREWVDLRVDIESAVEVVRPLLDKKALTFHITIDADLPAVYCDRTRIRQVILNLVSNAARYTTTGGIRICAKREGQSIVVRVADTGPGIAAQDIEKIFEPFYQSATNSAHTGGNGLGLTISRQFIELHHGRLWLESTVGLGSTFSFQLPILPPDAPVATAGRWINEAWMWLERSPRASLPKLPYHQRIVLCDESGELYPLFHHAYPAIEFVETSDWMEAVPTVQACPAHAVLISATQPDELYASVEQARQAMPDTPIIGSILPQRIDQTLAAGVLKYLIKPVTRADLRELLHGIGKPVRRILVVDDDRDFRQLLARMLRAYDNTLEVMTAADGEQALDLLQSSPPDLMLLDLEMPNMTGWQLLEIKNGDEALRTIPVTIVSAQDPLSQPVTGDTLIATIGQGIAGDKLLQCTLEFSRLLLATAHKPGLMRE